VVSDLRLVGVGQGSRQDAPVTIERTFIIDRTKPTIGSLAVDVIGPNGSVIGGSPCSSGYDPADQVRLRFRLNNVLRTDSWTGFGVS